MIIRKYGYSPSLGDFRNAPAPRNRLLVPSSVDLIEDASFDVIAPFDQGQLGSCTANAVSFCAWWYWANEKNVVLPEEFSRLYIYAKERELEGTPLTEDSGAFGHDGFKLLRKVGAPAEKAWPYDSNWRSEPPPVLAVEAHKYRVKYYRHPRQTKKALQSALSRGYPIAFGFTVYDSFESSQVAESGIMPMPTRSEKVLGGHEVCAVGYTSDGVKCRNSWGTEWGQGGYFIMPWEYILNPNLASDFRYFCAS